MQQNWPETHKVYLAPDFSIDLPLLDIGDGFCIYSFDMTGEAEWNRVAAEQLLEKLSGYDFDGFVTVQTKSCGLTQAISRDYPRYLEPQELHDRAQGREGEVNHHARRAGAMDRQGEVLALHGQEALLPGRRGIHGRHDRGGAGASQGDRHRDTGDCLCADRGRAAHVLQGNTACLSG